MEEKVVYILGSKGIPASYGGFETFVEKLTAGRRSEKIKYYVSCQKYADAYEELKGECYEHNGATCFPVKVPRIDALKSVYCDAASLRWVLRHIKENKVKEPVIFICTCRIGPYLALKKRKIRKLDATLIINPDGHEWLRAKWNALIKKYWRLSEKLSVKKADYIVCDSKSIEEYIKKEYASFLPQTTFIAYGSETTPSTLSNAEGPMADWLKKVGVEPGDYYLNVGRFVPENNYETIIREFMKSGTARKMVFVTDWENNSLYEDLKARYHFDTDSRIRFSSPVYDAQLIQKIKDDAIGYIHGHSVGGTNPSLLEALSSIDVNLLFEVGFNREVGEEAALYWTKEEGSLSALIEQADAMDETARKELGEAAKKRIRENYTWEQICEKYETVFLEH